MAADHESRSIAAEVALLFLNDLEPRVADHPELLLSSEAILSFATIRRSDPSQWQRWRSILTQYQKSAVIEYMLCEPPQIDNGGWESNASRLIALTLHSGVEFFHDPEQHGWASVQVDQHWENYPLRSRAFYLFLLRLFYRDTGESPGGRAMRAVLEIFEARALFDGPQCQVHLRVAQHDGKLYLDLCDQAWRAVEIDSEGWRIVNRPAPKFRRSRG